MRKLITLAAAASIASAGAAAVPTFASAQGYRAPPGASFREDPCRSDRRAAGNRGTVIGGIAGAVLGSQLAGRGARTEGAVIGAGVGAVAGHQIGKHSVSCSAYPRGFRARSGCRWVNDRYSGSNYSYQVCRGPDGYWRPTR
jgi:hypothetical protein